MCGIAGYIGDRDCADVLIDALSKLEYRGYDSAGIAVFENGTIKVEKCKGRLSNLVDKMKRDGKPEGHCGIGHTRWATHGEPSDINSHPHGNKRVSIVHNGIIENYNQLKDFLISEGYSFISETDTETVAKLLDYYYDGNPLDTIAKVIGEIKGSYALGIIFRDFPDTVYAVRKDSPLIVGSGEGENFIASDVPAIIHYTRDYYLLDTNDIAVVKKDSIRFYDVHKNEIYKDINTADWDVDAAEKGGYEHFMLKEIHEQPTAVKTTITPRIQEHMPDFTAEGFDKDKLKSYNNIYIVACGTAMHAGMVGKYVIEKLVRVPVNVDIASEFRYRDPLIGEGDLMIVISQSGETADTKAAMELAKERGADTMAIVNVKGSTIARESDYVLYTHAGPEIAVASTKAYSVQLAALYLIYCRMALVRGVYSPKQAEDFMKELLDAIPAMEAMISRRDEIKNIVTHIISKNDAFFIGRGLDYAFSLEGALKLKEISYIHAEAYAAGELKHGTIALISEQVPVIAIAPQEHIFAKTISNVREVKARGAFVILLVKDSAVIEDDIADVQIRIPDIADSFTVFPIAAILQLIAYYASVGKNLDVDQPRNLAKSVTVE